MNFLMSKKVSIKKEESKSTIGAVILGCTDCGNECSDGCGSACSYNCTYGCTNSCARSCAYGAGIMPY